MREILFRAKRIDNGEWIEGDLVHAPDGRTAVSTYDDLVETVPETVCQYTGLTDKNGRKIFEGDICKYYNPEDKDGIAVIREDYAEWISGAIRQKEIMTPIFYLKCSSEWEVFGNIFDNTDLIKE